MATVSATAEDQGEVIAFLSDPASHGQQDGEVSHVETHASVVFLAGDRAYKMKRALRYPYLDFSTLDLRREACRREVTLNRRTATDLYLRAAPILRETSGGLTIGQTDADEARAVEWVVVMRRFDQDLLLDRLAEDGGLGETMVAALGEEIARFHNAAEVILGPEADGVENFSWAVEESLEELLDAHDLFSVVNLARLADVARSELATLRPLLARRAAEGRVRRCHGDLHLGNIVVIDGVPRLFDCIEFNDRISCIDVLYDLAFLLMDLEHRGRRAEANQLLNRYLEESGDLEGLAALPLFLATRAAIRAKVHLSAATQVRSHRDQRTHRGEAASYVELAERFLQPASPTLIAIGGRSGSGKSQVARRLAPFNGRAPGGLWLRSDQIRKSLFGRARSDRLGAEAYTAEAGRRVYAELRRLAGDALAAGHAVVADATFLDPEERRQIEALAAQLGIPFHGLWLEAPRDTLVGRVTARMAAGTDISDADAAVVGEQISQETGPVTWTTIAADRPLEEVAVDAARAASLESLM